MNLNILLHRIWQLIAPRHTLYHDVLVLHTGLGERLLGSGKESIDEGRIPAGVDDSDAET